MGYAPCTCSLCGGGLERLLDDLAAFDISLMPELLKAFDYDESLRVMRIRGKLLRLGHSPEKSLETAKLVVSLLRKAKSHDQQHQPDGI
jgi:hypothetical protein